VSGTPPTTSAVCANCGTPLVGPYCAQCGQKARPSAPILREFVHDAAVELLNVDGKLFRSLRVLFLRPGFLTREAFADRRAAYVSPLRLYLLFSVLFFGVLALVPNALDVKYTYTPDGDEQVDAALVERKEAEMRAAVNDVTNRWIPRLTFVLMPVFGALVMLVCRASRRTYPEHLYFAMHVHSVAFFAALLLVAAKALDVPYLSPAIAVIVFVAAVAHFARALHVAYDLTTRGALWRALVLGTLYPAVLVGAVLAVWLTTAWNVIKQSG
jgi:hypothetical protein